MFDHSRRLRWRRKRQLNPCHCRRPAGLPMGSWDAEPRRPQPASVVPSPPDIATMGLFRTRMAPPPTGQFDPLAYGNWPARLSGCRAATAPGRTRSRALHIPGRVLAEAGSPTTAPLADGRRRVHLFNGGPARGHQRPAPAGPGWSIDGEAADALCGSGGDHHSSIWSTGALLGHRTLIFGAVQITPGRPVRTIGPARAGQGR